MLKAATGYSTQADAEKAGREAVAMASAGLGQAKAAFVYFSNAYDAGKLLKGLKTGLPDTPLIGCSACQGVIVPEGFIGGEHFIGLLALEDDSLKMYTGAMQFERSDSADEWQDFSIGTLRFDDNPVQTAVRAVEQVRRRSGCKERPSFFYFTSPPGMEEFYLQGVASAIGRAPFAGATAADSRLGTDWVLLTEAGPQYDGLALAFFYGEHVPTTHFSSPYRSSGDFRMITKMKGTRCLVEIDDRPALQVIADLYQCPVQLLRGGDLSLASPLSPIGVRDCSGDFIRICHPQYGNPDDSIFLGSPVYEGTALSHMECTEDDLVLSCGNELKSLRNKLGGQAGAFHLAMNYTWHMAAYDRFDELVDNLLKAAEDVPFLCGLTNGEHGFRGDSANICGGLMMSGLGFPA